MVNEDGQWLSEYDAELGPFTALLAAAGICVGIGLVFAAAGIAQGAARLRQVVSGRACHHRNHVDV